MIIDFHVHCDSADRVLVEQYANLCRTDGIMSALIGGLRYGNCDMVPNETVLEICREYSDVFIPMAKIDLWDKVEENIIERSRDAGFKGLKFIYPYYEYDHDIYMSIYESAEKLGLPCLFHTGMYGQGADDAVYRRPMLKNMHPITLDRIARSFPKLNIVCAHLGTAMYREEAAGLLWLHGNVYTDLAGNGSYQELSGEKLRKLLNPFYFVPDEKCNRYRKLVFGSDAYITHPEITRTARKYYETLIEEAPLEIRNAIMGDTVADWFGID